MNDLRKKRLALVFIIGLSVMFFMPFVAAQVPTLDTTWDYISNLSSEKFGDTPGEIIVSIVITLILFAGIYDILILTSIFHLNWVNYTIAGGIAIIAITFNWIMAISVWFGGIAGALGAIGIFIEIILAIVIFIGLAFGSKHIARFAARRKATMHEVKAIEGAAEAGDAIKHLKEMEEEFKA